MCTRCEWANSNELEKAYHDTEWGRVKHDDRQLFECLVLESMQSGLSWSTILQKRGTIRKAFDFFDIDKVAQYTPEKIEELLKDKGVIRHKRKLEATVTNAQMFKAIQQEFGSFDKYIWSFVENKPIVNHWESLNDVPSKTDLSDTLAKELKKRGFKFVGSTTVYSFMQSIGMVDDHAEYCFRKNS